MNKNYLFTFALPFFDGLSYFLLLAVIVGFLLLLSNEKTSNKFYAEGYNDIKFGCAVFLSFFSVAFKYSII